MNVFVALDDAVTKIWTDMTSLSELSCVADIMHGVPSKTVLLFRTWM